MKRFVKQVGEYADLYIDCNNGIAWIENGSTGCGHSCHSNIDASGSVKGMKNLGYWDKSDKTVRSHGFIYNISSFIINENNEYDRIVADECRCEMCLKRRNEREL